MEKSRAELLKTIEGQSEQLNRYESRLRDVVSAYKRLQSEKDALEASVTALSMRPTLVRPSASGGSSPAPGPHQSAGDASGSNSAAESDHDGAERQGTPSQVQDDLSSRLATLSSSLATITAEKSRMEASFQADKKQLLQDHDSLQRQYRTESGQQKAEIDKLKEQLEAHQLRLREQQLQSDEEQTNHAAMLRELQQLVADERMVKDDLEMKLESVKESASQSLTADRGENEKVVCKLNAEVKALKGELSQRGRTSQDDTMILQQVQVQMAQMKLQHGEALSKERQRVADADQRVTSVARREEERVAALEAQLAELTVMVGRYDRLREQDQQTISHLQEQVSECNKESIQLREQANSSDCDELKKEIVSLRDRHSKLKQVVADASPELLEAVESDSHSSVGVSKLSDQLHKACHERYKKISDEFEAFKASTSLAQRASKQESTSEELRRLQGQVRHLRDRLQPMQQQVEKYRSGVEDREQQIEQLQSRLEEEKHDHQKALSAALASHQQQLLSIQAARERSFVLLQDKEAEIEKLRTELASGASDDWARSSAVFSASRRRVGSSAHPSSPHSAPGTNNLPSTPGSPPGLVDQAVEDMLVHSSQTFPNTANGSLLHYAQQQQRVAAEVEQCRQQRDELLGELRDCREKADRYGEQCGMLKEEIRKLDRSKDRSTASLEYVKNVVLSYMTIDGHSPGRVQVANAIATILQFSPDERRKAIHNASQSAWWPPALKPGTS